MWENLPAGAGAVASMLLGHNPIVGAILGHAGKFLSRDAPDAAKLSLLKFLGSSGPVDAGAWKTAADMINHIYKGESLIQKSVKNIFKAGQEVLPKSVLPDPKDLKKIDKKVDEWAQNPSGMLDIGGKTAHYMPEHGQAMGSFTANAVNYLNSVKPRIPQAGLLDAEVPISKDAEVKYNRTLEIAQQPLMVLEHIKKGELQPQDVQGMQTMYPALYNKLQQQLTNAIVESKHSAEPIPYKTRLSMALFMAQPLDGTMKPEAIQAAQMVSPKAAEPQMPQPKQHGSMAKLGKMNQMYATPGQAREQTRQGKA